MGANNLVYNPELKVQYEIMCEKGEYGYTPNYDILIEEAPNEEMENEWRRCEETFKKMKKSDNPKLSAFAFNSVYMIKMSCGHYEIFQHPSQNEKELIDWIKLMQSPKYYHKCTFCVCDFK